MALRVKPTPTRFPTISLYIPMLSLFRHSAKSSRKVSGYFALAGDKASPATRYSSKVARA